MKRILVLGAGMVSRPLVDYLLGKGYYIQLVDIRPGQAAAILGDRENGEALCFDQAEDEPTRDLIRNSDLVISLLPPPFHPRIGRMCLAANRHFLTASYVGDEMRAMDDEARSKNLVFLNEVGLDPGIDHMTAMEMIDEARAEGFEIEEFISDCGGLPNRAAANNPLRYKFSWSPRGVLGALRRAARFRRDGGLVQVDAEHMLDHARPVHIPGAGIFESTPNADSLYYGECYGLEQTEVIYRGTLRYPGWAAFWRFMLDQGMLDQEREMEFDEEPLFSALLKLAGHTGDQKPRAFALAKAPRLASRILETWEGWGFMDESQTISGNTTAFDLILKRAEVTMGYQPEEADWVLLHHEFTVSKGSQRERWTSTILQEGKPKEQTTAMGLLVGVPAAVGAHLILAGEIKQTGVCIPLHKNIYQPILDELKRLGLNHTITKTAL